MLGKLTTGCIYGSALYQALLFLSLAAYGV